MHILAARDNTGPLIVVILVVLGCLIWLGWIPGREARRRQHPKRDAISAMGWIAVAIAVLGIIPPIGLVGPDGSALWLSGLSGLLAVGLWIAALLWSLSVPRPVVPSVSRPVQLNEVSQPQPKPQPVDTTRKTLCPSCGQRIKIDLARGRNFRCPRCSHRVVI